MTKIKRLNKVGTNSKSIVLDKMIRELIGLTDDDTHVKLIVENNKIIITKK